MYIYLFIIYLFLNEHKVCWPMAFSNIFSVVFLYPFLLLGIALSLSPSQLKPHPNFSHVPFHSAFVLRT